MLCWPIVPDDLLRVNTTHYIAGCNYYMCSTADVRRVFNKQKSISRVKRLCYTQPLRGHLSCIVRRSVGPVTAVIGQVSAVAQVFVRNTYQLRTVNRRMVRVSIHV